MHALLAIGDVLPGFADFILLVGELLVEHHQLLAYRLGLFLIGCNALAQRFDFTLAFEQAVLALVRRRHHDRPRWQFGAPEQGSVERIGGKHRTQPISQYSRNPRVVAAHAFAQPASTFTAHNISRKHDA